MSNVTITATTATGGSSVHADFVAGPGITALFGPSGAGKSVTLATIAGLLRPVTGTVTIEGTVVADAAAGIHMRTQERRLGMVFQDAALLSHRSPLDNVALAVRGGAGGRERREVARSWLERVQAGHLAHAPTAALSGGERQRVALARALAGDPRLLLLDEPFSALDHHTRVALRQLVLDIVADQDIAALLVTHDVDDILALATSVVVFEPGRTEGTYAVNARDVPALLRDMRVTPHGDPGP
ncbi:MAG: ABC transporter ATP-binding protein [Actinobacteria bacterium HGW-Actinobacteria-4]|nr:MAG: ABC transporter ATP-binding protein [Actinobacteria bacterium HGW-Actinobacteria-4]